MSKRSIEETLSSDSNTEDKEPESNKIVRTDESQLSQYDDNNNDRNAIDKTLQDGKSMITK